MDPNTCGVLHTGELSQMCGLLSSQISSLRTLPWVTALVGVLGAVLAAVLTTGGAHRVQKTERFNKAQREALIAAQNVALKLRGNWLAHFKYLQAGRTEADPFPDSEQAKTVGKFETALVRVDKEHLRDDYKIWAAYAQEIFSGNEDYESHVEEELWARTVHCSGISLRELDR